MNSRARTRTRQTLLVLGETLDTRYAANFKAWRKPVDDVICANATRNTHHVCNLSTRRRFPRAKIEGKNGRERDFRDSTSAMEGEARGGEMYVNFEIFRISRGSEILKIAYARLKKNSRSFFFGR